MAVSAELSTLDVVNALERLSIEETRALVFRLKVPGNILDNIDAQYSGATRGVKYVEEWLKRDEDASWEKLVSGLKQIKMNSVAKEVEFAYILKGKQATSSPTPLTSATPLPLQSVNAAKLETAPPSVTFSLTAAFIEPLILSINPTKSPAVNKKEVAEVKAEFEQFEEDFSNLKSDTREFLSDKESQDPRFLARFRDHLLDLPVSKRTVHARFFCKNEDEIFKEGTIEQIFAILRRYCNYSNYDIILHLVKRFCGVSLKRRMQKYCDSFESFEKATTVDIFLCAISANPEGEVYQVFSRMVMTIDKPASECTLHEVRQLKESLAESTDIHSYSAYIECMITSSVLVVLRIPPSCVVWVGVAMTPDFMQAHHLTEVSINGIDIKHYQSREYLDRQLCDSSHYGDVVGVLSLLSSGADVNAVNLVGESALTLAAREGKTEVVVELVKAGANVDLQTEVGDSALMRAAREDKTEVVVELVKAGANVDMQNRDGWSALIWAARKGKTEVVVELVKAGANVDMQTEGGDSALMIAAREGKTEVVVQLVKAGANVDMQNRYGDSAVISATQRHRSETVKELVASGANLNLQNQEGLTALMMSVRGGRTELTDILLSGATIDPDIREDSTGWTALFFAAEAGDVATMQSLIRAGANPLLKDKDGLTALDVAAGGGGTATRGVRAELRKHVPPVPPSRISQVLGLVKRSGRRIKQLFIQLDTRLKSVDEKSQMIYGDQRSGE